MKRWIAVVAGGFGLVAYLRRRRRSEPTQAEPADELRAKLAASRAESDEPAGETTEPAAADEVGDRRRDVHERARQAVDELG